MNAEDHPAERVARREFSHAPRDDHRLRSLANVAPVQVARNAPFKSPRPSQRSSHFHAEFAKQASICPACAASSLVNHCLPSSNPNVSIGPRAAQRPPMAPLAKAAGLFSCEPRRSSEKCPATRGTGREAIAQADLGRALRTVYHSANGRSREQRPTSRNNS